MREAFIKLHVSIVLAGFTGVLGKLISLGEGPLVWYRLMLTTLIFYCYLKLTGRFTSVPAREFLRIGGVGVLIALHWLFFYGSIKYANVSIGVVCFALTGFFTALFDPLISKRGMSLREIAFSLVTVAGIALIFHFDTRYRTGIVLGVLSAVMAALFTIATFHVGRKHSSGAMLFYQSLSGFLFLTALVPLQVFLFPSARLLPDGADVFYLTILASACTIGMFLLQIQALRKISPFTVNLSYNLEPVYSIILALVFFREGDELGWSFYVGLGLICVSVLLQTLSALRARPLVYSPAEDHKGM